MLIYIQLLLVVLGLRELWVGSCGPINDLFMPLLIPFAKTKHPYRVLPSSV